MKEFDWEANANSPDYPGVSPIWSGLRCRCPRCGQGHLFEGFLRVRSQCEVCKLDFSFADSGDGPAVFIVIIVGFIVTGGALLVEIFIEPPYWVHALLWLPLSIGLSLAILRPFKAVLINLQYHHKTGNMYG